MILHKRNLLYGSISYECLLGCPTLSILEPKQCD